MSSQYAHAVMYVADASPDGAHSLAYTTRVAGRSRTSTCSSRMIVSLICLDLPALVAYDTVRSGVAP